MTAATRLRYDQTISSINSDPECLADLLAEEILAEFAESTAAALLAFAQALLPLSATEGAGAD